MQERKNDLAIIFNIFNHVEVFDFFCPCYNFIHLTFCIKIIHSEKLYIVVTKTFALTQITQHNTTRFFPNGKLNYFWAADYDFILANFLHHVSILR
jgi:hypothetical protein